MFLESYFLGKHNIRKLPSYESTSIITSVYNHYKQQMYNHNKNNQNLRVHYTDIRTNTDLIFFMDMIYLLIQHLTEARVRQNKFAKLYTNFPTVQTLKTYSDMMLLSNSFENQTSEVFNGFDLHFSDVVVVYKNKKVHRIRKQLLKLDRKLQERIIKFHKDYCNNFIRKYSSYNTAVKNILKNNNNIHYDELVVLQTIIAWTSHLKDIYTLSRMLYYIIKGHKNIVSYDGYAHTQKYVNFFMNYLDDTEHVYTHSIIQSKTYNYIKIPKTVLEG